MLYKDPPSRSNEWTVFNPSSHITTLSVFFRGRSCDWNSSISLSRHLYKTSYEGSKKHIITLMNCQKRFIVKYFVFAHLVVSWYCDHWSLCCKAILASMPCTDFFNVPLLYGEMKLNFYWPFKVPGYAVAISPCHYSFFQKKKCLSYQLVHYICWKLYELKFIVCFSLLLLSELCFHLFCNLSYTFPLIRLLSI